MTSQDLPTSVVGHAPAVAVRTVALPGKPDGVVLLLDERCISYPDLPQPGDADSSEIGGGSAAATATTAAACADVPEVERTAGGAGPGAGSGDDAAAASGSLHVEADASTDDDKAASIRHCEYCGVAESDEVPLKQCARCKQACYCSPEHQKGDWKAGHKQKCVKTTENRTESVVKRVKALYQGTNTMSDVVHQLVGGGYV